MTALITYEVKCDVAVNCPHQSTKRCPCVGLWYAACASCRHAIWQTSLRPVWECYAAGSNRWRVRPRNCVLMKGNFCCALNILVNMCWTNIKWTALAVEGKLLSAMAVNKIYKCAVFRFSFSLMQKSFLFNHLDEISTDYRPTKLETVAVAQRQQTPPPLYCDCH